MQTVEQIRDKIEAAEGLHQVVKTMEGLAAVNIRQYQRANDSLSEYTSTVEQGLQVLLHHAGERLQLRDLPQGSSGKLLAVVFGSDQGMVGQFNSRIAQHFRDTLDKAGQAGVERWVLAIGRRVGSRFRSEGEEVVETFDLPRSAEAIAPRSQRLLAAVQHYRDRGARRVLLMHHVPEGGASYSSVTRHVFPLSIEWLSRLRQAPWPGPSLPMVRVDVETMLGHLVSQYLFVSLFRAFAGSLAAENASRLASMQAAERNIEERLDTLRNRYHRLRQSQITSELLDVIAGFETTKEQ